MYALPQRRPSDMYRARPRLPLSERASRLPEHPRAAAASRRTLAIGQPDGPHEQEAERVARQVTGMPEPQQRVHAGDDGRAGQQTASHSARMAAPTGAQEVLRSSGEALDAVARAFFEPRLGVDFSRVRIHSDEHAAESARAFGADAYTLGNHVVFGAGHYAPGRPDGHRLLAHELVHVMQQHAAPGLVPAAGHLVLRQPEKPESGEQGTKEAAEEEQRAKLLAEMTGGADLPERQVSRIASAMRAFSLNQLRAIRAAGVRFWAPDSLPPEFADNVKVANLSTPGEYLDTIRVIRMARNASTDAIRHEIAHAWDHVRTGKVKPIGKLKGKAFEKALEETPPLSSATKEKRPTVEIRESKRRVVSMPISEMFKRYKRWTLREQSFDNPSTRESHSKKSTREFYAEGYSVFHGGNEWNQARLLFYAPELYEYLEVEAKQQGLGIPDRARIEAALKEQKLQ
jgi:hypothetical protein